MFFSEEVDEVSPFKQVKLQYSQHLMDGLSNFCLEFDVEQHQINNEGNPDLRHDGVFRGAEEGLDLQVLLEPFEEKLDLPTFLVKFSHHLCLQMKRIGQKMVGSSILRGLIDNSTVLFHG